MSNQIHPSAIVSSSAELGNNNRIGAYAIIEDGVRLGDDNVIAAHATLKFGTRMAHRNRVYEHAVIGGAPQHVKFTDESIPTFTEIVLLLIFLTSIVSIFGNIVFRTRASIKNKDSLSPKSAG